MCGIPVKGDDSLIPIYSVFIGLAVLAVILRIVARVITHAYFWWDDFANLFGFVRCPGPPEHHSVLTAVQDWLCPVHCHEYQGWVPRYTW